MKPFKSLTMKTYGKQIRKVSAWLSPENRKQVFDSSVSTDGDISVFEPSNNPLKRQKRTRVSDKTNRVGRLAKRKAMLCLLEQSTSSSFESTQERHNCPPKRKAQVYRSPTSPQTTQEKKNTSDHPPSAGRFVTRRRRTVTAKSKNPKVSFNLFNSSDDSALGALGSSRVLKPRRRKVPPAFVPSSAENTEILSGISSFPPSTLKEIPLNVLSDHTLGSRPRKPIFCSTPSAGHFPNRPCLKHNLDSLGHSELHSEGKLHLSFGEQETSGDLFVRTKISNITRSCREGGKENSVVTENKMGEGSLSGNLFSSESLESNSQFLSATGDREWLINALKEKCLHVPCTVQLDRLYNPTVSQLSSQTTYSSCSGHSRKGYSYQISEPLNLHLSVSSDKTNASLLSVDTQSISPSPSKKPKGQSTSVQCGKTSCNATRDKKRSTSTDRSGTTRKACVSGLSVNRWKNKDSSVPVDCSISKMISANSRKQNQMKEVLGTTINFSTPLRVSRLNLSSLLADFTPNTHTWSRIKAVLSVHRKSMVLQNPSSSSPWILDPRTDVSQDLFATPRSAIVKRLPCQLLHNSSLVECADADLSDAEKVYAECGQQCPLPWEECILPQRMKQCVKIGEGTFGEVFTVINASGETVALKVIPVEGCEQVNGEDQKTFGEILHEIIISKELSHLKEKEQNQTDGFIRLIDLHCVQGRYPSDFMEAWDTFNQKKSSENDRPDFFKKDQIFIILEFEFGGVDLENSNGKLASLGVAKSILHQVTAALAVAEQELHFEHRDLHWGNVLVKPTKQKKGSFVLNGTVHSVETRGVLVRIIDYSLSRLEIDDLTVSCDISSDEELFMGQGDYQFDIYRLMRKENGNNWTNYHPHTNVLWLHYLCSKLLSMEYRSARGKAFKQMLTQFSDSILNYKSATEVLQTCPIFQE